MRDLDAFSSCARLFIFLPRSFGLRDSTGRSDDGETGEEEADGEDERSERGGGIRGRLERRVSGPMRPATSPSDRTGRALEVNSLWGIVWIVLTHLGLYPLGPSLFRSLSFHLSSLRLVYPETGIASGTLELPNSLSLVVLFMPGALCFPPIGPSPLSPHYRELHRLPRKLTKSRRCISAGNFAVRSPPYRRILMNDGNGFEWPLRFPARSTVSSKNGNAARNNSSWGRVYIASRQTYSRG